MAEGAPGDVGLPGAGEVPAELDAVLAAKLESAAARDAPDLGTDLRAVCGGVLPDAHQVFARRFRRSWTPFLQQSSKARRLGMLLIWGPIFVLFAAAFFPTLIKFLRVGYGGWMLHLAIVHYAINSIVFFALARYRFPIEGLCIILACVSVPWRSETGRPRNKQG